MEGDKEIVEVEALPVSELDVSYRGLNAYFRQYPNRLADYGSYVITGKVGKTASEFLSFGLTERIHKIIDDENPIIEWELKFHISLPEDNKDTKEGELSYYARGWEIVRDILIRRRVAAFKIAKDNILMSSELGEAGKDITIYAYQDASRNIMGWFEILREITQQLVIEGIPPGYRIEHPTEPEFKVDGSNYAYYRYQKHELYKEELDPCLGMEVVIEGEQQEPRVLELLELQDPPRPNRCCCRLY